ncbi:MAG TPA: glycosyltransferase, partial [Gemmata sp.]|nr:glycosyltransferase [Gemmata sp.]
MHPRPWFSLIVPTRARPAQLRRFLASVAETAFHPERIEILLVIDTDDPASAAVDEPRLNVRKVPGPPGRTMGELNSAGYGASTGDRVMLLNDDVIVRTRGWDAIILDALRRFPDPFVLVHVNDTLIREHLCVFPLVSRAFCDLAGGICPKVYLRYRIDDHIEDVFNILAALGERRTIYLPDIVFEHTNAIDHPTAGRVYESDPAILAIDAPLFDALYPERKELALRVLEAIAGTNHARRNQLHALTDPFALRVAGRQLVVRSGRAWMWEY